LITTARVVTLSGANRGTSREKWVNVAGSASDGDFDAIFGKGSKEDGYNVGQFYTDSSDHRGHNVSTKVTLPPEVSGQISEVVQSGQVPQYRTANDLIRDAIVHRLHWLNENVFDDDHLRSVLTFEMMTTVQENYVQEIGRRNDFIERTLETLTTLEANDRQMLVQALDWHEDAVENWPEVWRDQVHAITENIRNRNGIKRTTRRGSTLKAGQGNQGDEGAGVIQLDDRRHHDTR
jgi:hypothetical protein